MNLQVLSGKTKVNAITLSQHATVADLKREYSKICKKSIHRLSFKKSSGPKIVRLDSDARKLIEYGIINGDSVDFKDLGPQIGYRTVFVVEYLGPLVFVLLYALRPSIIFGAAAKDEPYNWVAKLGIACWCAHFAKREIETFFVHKFSRPTMPLSNLFKNCMYYWAFGLVIGYPLCSPYYKAPAEIMVYIGLAIFVLCEVGNLACHIMLSNLRPAEGSQQRPIPRGFMFDYVACPNYTFEVLAWVGFSVMTNIPASFLFTLVGLLQMADWAQKKHQGYKKTYDKEYKQLNKKAIIPFIY